MTDEKIIEVMENMKYHADRTDDKELIEACDGAIKAIKDNVKLKEAVNKIKVDIKDLDLGFADEEYSTGITYGIMKINQIIDKHTEGLL